MNSGSWSAYRAAMPLECHGDPDGDRPTRCPGKCDRCGRFVSRKAGSGSRLDYTPSSIFGPEKVELWCPECAKKVPLPPTPEQLREAEESAREADREYTRLMVDEANAEAAARAGCCDYCGTALDGPPVPGRICAACEASIEDVRTFDSEDIPW